jgi:murein DD-endopeptidase MepM/ murein hydrolase activator NlpD
MHPRLIPNPQSLIPFLAVLFCCVVVAPQGVRGDNAAEIPKDRAVHFLERKYNNLTTLYARLDHCSEATITIRVKLKNMVASQLLPLTVDANGRREFDLLTILPADRTKAWNYELKEQWQIGRRGDVKNSPFVYALPYLGDQHVVGQGHLGKFSHYQGSGNEYAIDWNMPVGTIVAAAREGAVVAVRQDSDVHGTSKKYEGAANYVVIRHDDGTFAEYIHLRKNGALVQLGEKVRVHQPVALSGNTGFSDGPHLHFAVFCNIDGDRRRTIPVLFRARDGRAVTPKEGSRY